MDVTLVLTHRYDLVPGLACSYCYAGEHHKAAIDDATLERAVDLLWADGASVAQLSFFGGEPFLQPERMQRAIARARAAEAAVPGRSLLLQCTTNGTLVGAREAAFVRAERMRVVVSIDGVREAHELNRPRAGGGSSFASVYKGLRTLVEAGCAPQALMVVTPATALFAFRSVRWLWDEGVEVVRANLDARAGWSPEFRADLHAEMVALGRELLHRRLRGKSVAFVPFEVGAAGRAGCASDAAPRLRVVVGTSGNLYPCGPMVGEDRVHGPEAGVRIGHLDDGAEAIVARVQKDGVSCGTGGACACAAYLETGDRNTPGANSRWFGKLCADVGGAVAAGLVQATPRRTPTQPPEEPEAAEDSQRRARRQALVGLAVGAGGLALAATGLVQIRRVVAPSVRTAGEMPAAQPPQPQPIAVPPPQPPQPIEPAYVIAGEPAYNPPPPPPHPREPAVDGEMLDVSDVATSAAGR